MKKILIILGCFLLVACAHPESSRTSRTTVKSDSRQGKQAALQCDSAISKVALTMAAVKSSERHTQQSCLEKEYASVGCSSISAGKKRVFPLRLLCL